MINLKCFSEGDAVPEWLFTVREQHCLGVIGKFTFNTDCVVYEENGGFVVAPVRPHKKPLRLTDTSHAIIQAQSPEGGSGGVDIKGWIEFDPPLPQGPVFLPRIPEPFQINLSKD